MTATSTIVRGEALTWLAEHPAALGTSAVTSLPDRSELAGVSFGAWRDWFVNAARAVLRWLPADGVAIFYQTDVRHDEVWVDKGQLVSSAAAAESLALVWHKIVCRRPPGSSSSEGWPSYSHLLCFSRQARAPRRPAADVLTTAGETATPRAMGFAACQLACEYLRDETPTRRVVDPFCGTGSVLAVASVMGFDVIGVDSNAKSCRAARTQLTRVRTLFEAVRRGAELFERGEFFEAHEVWEDRWRSSKDEHERRGVQGLIQVAAAFHKLFVMRAPDSAANLLAKALAKLDATAWLPGIDIVALRAALRGCEAELNAGTLVRAGVPRMLSAHG